MVCVWACERKMLVVSVLAAIAFAGATIGLGVQLGKERQYIKELENQIQSTTVTTTVEGSPISTTEPFPTTEVPNQTTDAPAQTNSPEQTEFPNPEVTDDPDEQTSAPEDQTDTPEEVTDAPEEEIEPPEELTESPEPTDPEDTDTEGMFKVVKRKQN